MNLVIPNTWSGADQILGLINVLGGFYTIYDPSGCGGYASQPVGALDDDDVAGSSDATALMMLH